MARAGLLRVTLCVSAAAAGCAASNGAEPVGGSGGAAGMAGSGGGELCVANQTQPCTCGQLPGRAVCSSAAIWSLCDCGQGGSVAYDPSINPPGNRRADIMWDWTETVTGNCEAGRYEGTFTCTYVPMGGNASMGTIVTGPIVMTLTKSSSGEFLEITDGKLEGATALIIGFRSALSGRLNCATKEFGARAEMGLWGIGLALTNPFDGVLDAKYDDITSTLTGNWALNEMLTMGVCTGPWNAHRVGP